MKCDQSVRVIEELQKIIVQLQQKIAELESKLAAADARIIELELKLKKNSNNSSRPPSSNGPQVGLLRKKKKSGKKQGAQPGHVGHARKLAGPEQIDKHVAVSLEGSCPACGETGVVSRAFTKRHQVWEIPQITPHITEYMMESGRCACCRQRRCAELPIGVSSGVLGLRAKAMVATLTGQYRLSRRNAEQMLKDLFGLDIALGTVSQTEAKVSRVIEAPCLEVLQAAQESKAAHVDETGHKRAGQRLYSWVISTAKVVAFKVGYRRNRETAQLLLGPDFSGVVISDRYSAYSYLPSSRHQVCWAHLKREFQAIADHPELSAIGEQLLEVTKTIFDAWWDYKQRTIERHIFLERIKEEQAKLEKLLGEHYRVPEVRPYAHLFLLQPELVWNFTQIDGVEPTNNMAERDLRPLVIWRKTSFGTNSVRGDRYVERMMTLVGTCRKQGQNAFKTLLQMLQAVAIGMPAPTLLSESCLAD